VRQEFVSVAFAIHHEVLDLSQPTPGGTPAARSYDQNRARRLRKGRPTAQAPPNSSSKDEILAKMISPDNIVRSVY
jgi:hypothetical protein